MSTSTFSGPVQTGTVRQGQYDNAWTVENNAILPIAVTAVANTDLGPIYIPAGSTITTITCYTGTAFGAATNANLTVGSAAGGAQYVAAVDVKAQGTTSCTLVAGALGSFATAGSGLMNTATDTTVSPLAGAPTTPLYVRITQVGTASATGAATLVVKYIQGTA